MNDNTPNRNAQQCGDDMSGKQCCGETGRVHESQADSSTGSQSGQHRQPASGKGQAVGKAQNKNRSGEETDSETGFDTDPTRRDDSSSV